MFRTPTCHNMNNVLAPGRPGPDLEAIRDGWEDGYPSRGCVNRCELQVIIR